MANLYQDLESCVPGTVLLALQVFNHLLFSSSQQPHEMSIIIIIIIYHNLWIWNLKSGGVKEHVTHVQGHTVSKWCQDEKPRPNAPNQLIAKTPLQ